MKEIYCQREGCNKKIHKGSKRTKYCSADCYKVVIAAKWSEAANANRRAVAVARKRFCITCATPLAYVPGEKLFRTCEAHRPKPRHVERDRVCLCGKPFKLAIGKGLRNYCSMKCKKKAVRDYAAKWMREHYQHINDGTCAHCHEPFYSFPRRKFCTRQHAALGRRPRPKNA